GAKTPWRAARNPIAPRVETPWPTAPNSMPPRAESSWRARAELHCALSESMIGRGGFAPLIGGVISRFARRHGLPDMSGFGLRGRCRAAGGAFYVEWGANGPLGT